MTPKVYLLRGGLLCTLAILIPLLLPDSPGTGVRAQNMGGRVIITDREAVAPFSPAGMALHYIALDWTPEQWDTLSGRHAELVYLVDTAGLPTLRVLRGVDETDLRDSFFTATDRLPRWLPTRRDGKPQESLYALEIDFPAFGTPYEEIVRYEGFFDFTWDTIAPDTIATHYRRTGSSGYIDFNVAYNTYYGRVKNYLNPGVAWGFHVWGRGTKSWTYGLSLGGEFNNRSQPFPIDPFPNRDDRSSTGFFIGGFAGPRLLLTERSDLTLNLELAYGQLSASDRIDPESEIGYSAYRGFHSGLRLNYSLRPGRYQPVTAGPERDELTALMHGINLVAGVRHRYYGNREGTGLYLFAGLGYRFANYTLRRR